MDRLKGNLVLCAVIFLASCVASAQTAGAPDFDKARAEAVEHLAALVKLDTSNPPGNEILAAEYIKRVLDREGIASEIIESAPGRASIVARLAGNGKKKPLLLMGHMDVVGVEREHWTVDPFGAEIKDGYLYGRGATDDKGMVAANLEIFLLLHRLKVPLDRDVIFLGAAGEEGTTEFGIDFLVEKHWEKIACEYALNEGGDISVGPDGKLRFVGVSTTQKVPRGMVVTARGTSGPRRYWGTDRCRRPCAIPRSCTSRAPTSASRGTSCRSTRGAIATERCSRARPGPVCRSRTIAP